jgi:hypothetical protein
VGLGSFLRFIQKVLAAHFVAGSFNLFSQISTLSYSYADHQSTRAQRPPRSANQIKVSGFGR